MICIKEVRSMKNQNFIGSIVIIALILTMTRCEAEDNRVIIKEPGKTITILDESEPEATKQEENVPELSVVKIDHYDRVNIYDWLDEDTVIVSKENESLDKLSLAELSEFYPRSLYLLNLTAKDYELVKEQEEVFLGGAVFSKDKKYLLYYDYSLGDPGFHVMSMDTSEGFGIMGEPIGGAISAKWADNDTVIGAAYSGGVYLADRTGSISIIEDLKAEPMYIVEKTNNTVFYSIMPEGTLMKLNLDTKEKNILDVNRVYDTLLSPDGRQMLMLQSNGTNRMTLLVYNLDTGEKVTAAEGAELKGFSWSPDQRRIAYSMKEPGAAVSSLYVYDLLTGKADQIAVDVESTNTSWSPSGNRLAYMEWDETYYYNSSIIYFEGN
jgi:TolB protein